MVDISDNLSIIQNIINIFNNNLEYVDVSKVKEVYDKIVEKDSSGESGLEVIVDNIFEGEENFDDKINCDHSTKETTQNTGQNSSSSNTNFNNEQFGSSNQNEKSNDFKNSSGENLKKKYCDIANEIFEIIEPLDKKKQEKILTEVKNHFNNK